MQSRHKSYTVPLESDELGVNNSGWLGWNKLRKASPRVKVGSAHQEAGTACASEVNIKRPGVASFHCA